MTKIQRAERTQPSGSIPKDVSTETASSTAASTPDGGSLSGGSGFDIEAYRREKRDRISAMTEQAVDRLATSLEAGKSETLLRYLKTMSRFHRYSMSNQLLIYFQDPDATHVAGYERWKQFGRQVRRGEKGILILAPITKVVGTQAETDDSGQRVERPIRRIVNAKGVYVFDVRQTEGKELPQFASVQGDATQALAGLEAIFDAEGVQLSYVKRLPPNVKGVSKGKAVEVLDSLPTSEKFSVAVHELAHELLHRDERREKTTVKVRETEAEAVAFVVCQGVGLDCSTAASDYIHLYHGSKQTLEESLRFIRVASLRILSDLLPSEKTRDSVQGT